MAVDMFLKVTKIDGESKDDTHKDEIDVLAWSWGLSQRRSERTLCARRGRIGFSGSRTRIPSFVSS